MTRLSLMCMVFAFVFGLVVAAPITKLQFSSSGIERSESKALDFLKKTSAEPVMQPAYVMLTVQPGPNRTSNSTYPVLIWPGNEKRIQKANRELQELVNSHLKKARDPSCSFYVIRSSVQSLTPKVVSVRIQYSYMSEGMVHPFNAVDTFNFDLDLNRRLNVADVCVDKPEVFVEISNYCYRQLVRREPDLEQDHALITSNQDSFDRFTINQYGIGFVFSSYPYFAADYRQVTVPFDHSSLKPGLYEHKADRSESATIDYDEMVRLDEAFSSRRYD